MINNKKYIIRPDGSILEEFSGMLKEHIYRDYYYFNEMYNYDGWYFISLSQTYYYLISGRRIAVYDPENTTRNKCLFTGSATYKTKEEIEKIIKMKSFI